LIVSSAGATAAPGDVRLARYADDMVPLLERTDQQAEAA